MQCGRFTILRKNRITQMKISVQFAERKIMKSPNLCTSSALQSETSKSLPSWAAGLRLSHSPAAIISSTMNAWKSRWTVHMRASSNAPSAEKLEIFLFLCYRWLIKKKATHLSRPALKESRKSWWLSTAIDRLIQYKSSSKPSTIMLFFRCLKKNMCAKAGSSFIELS